jgi:hypothetical protein
VDASIAMKVVVAELDSDKADALIDQWANGCVDVSFGQQMSACFIK